MTLGLRHAIASQTQAADLPTTFIVLLAWTHHVQSVGSPTLLRHPFAHNDLTWYGNINPLSIAYASQPRLRPD